MTIKKSQIAMFFGIGIGIILLLATIVAVSVNINKADRDSVMSEEISLDQESIQRHVEECILNSKHTIKKIARNGGELIPAESIKYNNKNYTFWCYQTETKGCENQIYSKARIQQTLKKELKPVIDNCLNFSRYETSGYNVELQPSDLDVKISPLFVDIVLNKRITITRNDDKVELYSFAQKINLPIGRVIDVANLILNSELENNYFDKDNWMKEHGVEIKIKKSRPYPNKLYSLLKFIPEQNEWIELNFGIKGKDTVSDLKTSNNQIPSSWCVLNNECFFNPSQQLCSNISSSKPSICDNLLYDNNPICVGDSCNDCGKIEHGTEWCEYDSVTGGGIDAVGSRHYVKSCINGEVYVEECRDYREEICVQNSDEAMCKPNRWKSCMQQDNRNDCLDTSERDCYWFDTKSLFNKDKYPGDEQIKCFPQVAPGFKFWNYHGMEVCQMNNEWMDCDDFSCPQQWSDISMLQCKKLGDCGNGYNTEGVLSTEGFYTTDLMDNPDGPSTDLLLDPVNTNINRYLTASDMTYKFESFSNNAFKCKDCTFNDILKRVKEFTEYVASLDKDDLMWEYIWNGEVKYHTRHFTLCLPYQLYETGDCNSCLSESQPCSEYKCKSLGSKCFFYMDENGYGQCKEAQSSNVPLTILPSTIELVPDIPLESDDFSYEFTGFKLKEPVSHFSPITVKFNTSKLAQCKKSRIPLVSNSPIDIDFSQTTPEPGFFIEHEFTFYSLPYEYIKSELEAIVSIQTYLELLTIENIDQKLDAIMSDIRSAGNELGGDTSNVEQKLNEVRAIYNSNIKPQIEFFQNTFGELISNYLMALELDIGYVFFSCIDTEGNPTFNNVYLSYDMKNDNNPPGPKSIEILNDDISNSKLEMSLIMNEPSECRASFYDEIYENMNMELECSKNYLSVDTGYECVLNTTKSGAQCSDDSANVYVRCRDKIYETNISKTNINQNSYIFEFKMSC